MPREPLIMACCSDIAGLVRGKAFPLRDLERRLTTGVGWCPTNVQITAFNNIAETPFGPLGDALLMPDPAARVEIEFGDDDPGERFVLGDITETDGTPWACCLRTLLKGALATLEEEAGLGLRASFEHEFHYADDRPQGGGGYGLRSFRAAADFAERFAGALDQAGIEVELIQPEYGISQLEVSVTPRPGLEAADQAVILREVARAVARRPGASVTFAPIVAGMGVGNGVHVHLEPDRPRAPAGDARSGGCWRAQPDRRQLRRRHPAPSAGVGRVHRGEHGVLPAPGAASLERRLQQSRLARSRGRGADLPGARGRGRRGAVPRRVPGGGCGREPLSGARHAGPGGDPGAARGPADARSRPRAIWRCSTRPRSRRRACVACRPRCRQRSRRSRRTRPSRAGCRRCCWSATSSTSRARSRRWPTCRRPSRPSATPRPIEIVERPDDAARAQGRRMSAKVSRRLAPRPVARSSTRSRTSS